MLDLPPSIGRIVHFYSDAVANRDQRQPGNGFNGMGSGPYPAIVTQVSKDGERVTYVNLKVLPPFAPPFDEGSVSEGAANCPGRYWEWPPREVA